MSEPLEIKRDGAKIWSHLRSRWLEETPEETVRQTYLCVLVNEYGFTLGQMAEELEVTGRGTGHARADFVIWRTEQDKLDNSNPLIVVECKSDNVTISAADYAQGDNYSRLTGSRFFATHNTRETKYWRVVHERMPKSLEEIANIPHADASDREIAELISQLKVFKEDEFADLLHQCHNVIRNREKLDPAAAFDEIAKILFVKVYVERELKEKRRRKNLFTTQYLDDQIGKHPLNTLFRETKEAYADDQIFDAEDEIRLKPSTGREIVKRLERYNLSGTSEDIKGIAFERFLGRTFRGEIGQFFTPRAIVEFMIRMVQPVEGERICDPASGSGGFLIRFFELVREQILRDADAEYQALRDDLDGQSLSEAKRAEILRLKYAEIQEAINQQNPGSRLWTLANRCIYGTDANDRMARTSKMNMIMHGDGHGGVHHHDGFLNVNGVFEGRFDIVLTNPPFGASVEPTDIVHEADVHVTPALERRYQEAYGSDYSVARERVQAAVNKPIASLYELPKSPNQNVKTEILFLERCLSLLRPGGRLGIVLPEGIFNNPSLEYVREFCENRGFIRAVVSLPRETFLSSGASVKATLLFLRKFTEDEQDDFDRKRQAALDAARAAFSIGEVEKLRLEIDETDDRDALPVLRQKLRALEKVASAAISSDARRRLRESFDYSIFMYDAKRVGITATGEMDANELFPNDHVPDDVSATCLEQYVAFETEFGGHQTVS